ncbi:anaphase-promoting complex subunit 2 isoform X1 [Schistocerca cancellata]|uniref:anaphase-promoting complex subunit 2 isoform X1 n=1 Tax=Schistocerca cancellata TaxID=274614 RepID=UPI0021188E62|nr:anaphase-promoting complex subunit 2 isoform X1 [Schistocerca cancellata]
MMSNASVQTLEIPSKVYENFLAVFPILKAEEPVSGSQDTSFIADVVREHNLGHFLEDLVLSRIQKILRQKIAPEFWSKFSGSEGENEGFGRFKDAVNNLYNRLHQFLPVLEKLEKLHDLSASKNHLAFGQRSVVEEFKVLLRATLHSQLPLNHSAITEDFYRRSFKVFCNSDKTESDIDEVADSENVVCGGCGTEIEGCQCRAILDAFHETNRKLIEMELLERLSSEVITSLIHVRIEKHVHDSCKGSFDTSYLASLDEWLETVVMGWLTRIYCAGTDAAPPSTRSTQEALNKFKQKLSHFLYETYTRTRIEQLFNIIIEYPDSQPAVEDLRVCLQKTDLRKTLVQRLQRALETRLLHPGVNTGDILTAYVAAIRALRQLDPSGVLLDTVTQPVRQYLRHRDDTVRCVVSSLTEEDPNELADELVRGEVLALDEGSISDDDATTDWESWTPDPVDADPSKPSKSRRTSDIISMLVNVYGSKDLFVNEYRTLLADRLLSQFNYNTEKEIRYLELLKLRFGEAQLHYCEVMLKDVYDSKRINAHLHSDPNFSLEQQKFPVCAMVLSAQFWPPFKGDTLELPPFIKEHLDVYTKAFETLKGNRTLCWKPHLGAVNLDIELKDRNINLTVSPIHATIIWHFQTKNQWTIEELSQEMRVAPTILRRRMAFWQSQGLVREMSTDNFVLVEETVPRSRGPTASDMMCEDEEAESPMASAHDQREEELQVFWSYIVGMLTNLDSMPLERIHQMLKMFASQGPTSVECNIQELRHFLDRKVREHQLLFSGGYYRLPKS